METCIFCKIVSREIPAKIVFEDESILAFEDINPVAPFHILVIPKMHIQNVLECTPEHDPIVVAIHQGFQKIAAQKSQQQFRVITNCGKDAGQTVFHLHYHMIGGKAMGELLPQE